MHDAGDRWRLVVPTGGDTLRQERLTRDLYEALHGAGGIAVRFETDRKAVEPGDKGAGVTDVVLWAVAALPASPVLITLIKEWCAKDRHRTVNVVHGEHSITITGRPDAAQERMVRDFLNRVSAGTEGRAE